MGNHHLENIFLFFSNHRTSKSKFTVSLPPTTLNLGGISSFRRFKAVHVAWPTAALLLPMVPWIGKMTMLVGAGWCWLVGRDFLDICEYSPIKNFPTATSKEWNSSRVRVMKRTCPSLLDAEREDRCFHQPPKTCCCWPWKGCEQKCLVTRYLDHFGRLGLVQVLVQS